MSIPEAFKGAALEFSRLPVAQRAKYVARTSGLLVKELLGTLRSVPFAIRSRRLHNGLKSQKNSSGVASRFPAVSLAADVKYGPRIRNVMDIYSPCAAPAAHSPRGSDSNHSKSSSEVTDGNEAVAASLAPVVLFVHGGVWASGSKWHYALMATRLAQEGCVVCVMEYSLYPQANLDCMVREVSDALSWLCDNIDQHGGDCDAVSLFGHSAGAHLCAMALLHRAMAQELLEDAPSGTAPGMSPLLSASDSMYDEAVTVDDGRLCTLDGRMPAHAVFAAGVFDIAKHYEFEEARGVHMLSTMERVMGGWAAIPPRSPTKIVAQASERQDTVPVFTAALNKAIASCDALSVATRAESGEVDHRAEACMHDATTTSMHLLGRGSAETDVAKEETSAAAVATLKRTRLGSESDADGKLKASKEQVGTWDEYGWSSGGGWKRKRVSDTRSVVPPSQLLDPPERKAYYSSFELAGDAISNRLGMFAVADSHDHAHGAGNLEAEGGKASHGEGRFGEAAAASMVDRRLLDCGGVSSLAAPDAAERFAACLSRDILQKLPPTVLMCGSKDVTVPWHESVEFYRALCGAGVRARNLLYDDVDHAGFVTSWRPLRRQHKHASESIEEGPKFTRDLVQIVTGKARV